MKYGKNASIPRPIFVRTLAEGERDRLKACLLSSDDFDLGRCQIILASARGEHTIAITQNIGCSGEAVREAIKVFDRVGL